VRSLGRPFADGDSERGTISILAAGILVLVAVLSLVCVDLLRAVDGVARAQTAADAAALAAAQELAIPSGRDPADAAAEWAERNGAALRSCACTVGSGTAVAEVEVTVPFVMLGPERTVRARAKAVVEGRQGDP
jgi:secretion/DNA translocation related TadE-like protein